MKKNFLRDDHELMTNKIVRIIWDGKIKIALIMIVILLIAYAEHERKPASFTNSMIISLNKNFEFINISNINNFLNYSELDKIRKANRIEQIPINEKFLDGFIKELMDYEELISVLGNNDKIKKDISRLPFNDQQQTLFNYAKAFTIGPVLNRNGNPPKKNISYVLNFTFNDVKENRDIIDQTLKLTSANFKNSIFQELDDRLEIKRIQALNNDLQRIEFLSEQSLIARELDIRNTRYSTEIYTDVTYYRRGFKVIDKEINLIRNRKYKEFDIIKKELDILKEIDVEWISYNMFLLETRSLKSPQPRWYGALLLGSFVGILYALFTSKLLFKKVNRKKN